MWTLVTMTTPRERRNNKKTIFFFSSIYSIVCVGLVCDAHNRKTRVAQRSMVVQREWVTAIATRCFVFFFLYNRVHHPDILSSFDQKKERDVVYNIGCVLYKNILLSKRNFRSLLLFTSCFHPPTPDLIWWKETLLSSLFVVSLSILIEIFYFYLFL